MSFMRSGLCQLALVMVGLLASPAVSFARDYRPHEGYVDSTLAERGAQSTDLQLIDQPK